MKKTENATKRPFHETIVDAIGRANTYGELQLLAQLIKATKVPKNHDEIIAAWKQRWQVMGWRQGDLDLGVSANLLEQKQEAAAQEKDKEQTGAISS